MADRQIVYASSLLTGMHHCPIRLLASYNFSESQHTHLQNGDNNHTYSRRLSCVLKEIKHVKHLAQGFSHNIFINNIFYC